MRALLLRWKAELRQGWRAPVVLGIVAGLAGGAVLTAVAGARRTDSAYQRMLAVTDAVDYTMRLAAVSGTALDADAVRALPGVERVGVVDRFYLTTPGPRSTVGSRPPVLASSSDGISYREIGRPVVVEGRMPDPDRPNEILVSRILADEGSFDVGDPAPLVLVTPDETAPDGLRTERVSFRVVGVGTTPDQVAVDQRRRAGCRCSSRRRSRAHTVTSRSSGASRSPCATVRTPTRSCVPRARSVVAGPSTWSRPEQTRHASRAPPDRRRSPSRCSPSCSRSRHC